MKISNFQFHKIISKPLNMKNTKKAPPHFNVNQSLLVLVCILILNITNVFSQCTLTIETCTVPEYTTDVTSSTINDSPYNWISDKICLSADLTINEDFTIGNSEVYIAANKKITVNTGYTLTITNSQLFAQGNMWDRITVQSGAFLYVENSTIADAFYAVFSENTTGGSYLEITGSTFCNNELAIYFGPFGTGTPAAPSIIVDNIFTAPALKAPKAGQVGDYGIFVDQLRNVQIGDDAVYSTSTTYNYFTDLNIAIRCHRGAIVIQDNFIDHTTGTIATMPTSFPLNETYSNVGVCVTSITDVTYSPAELKLGKTVLGSGYNNEIKDAKAGVIVDTRVYSFIYSNRIRGLYTGSDYTMEIGIDIENIIKISEIKNNRIERFKQYGIYMKDIGESLNYIGNNTISTINNFSNPAVPTGIRVFESVLTTNHYLTIENNTVDLIKTGIQVRNIKAPIIYNNVIEFSLPSPATGVGYGMRIESCPSAQILTNKSTGICGGGCGDKVRLLYIESCSDFFANQNALYDGYAGIYLNYSSVNGNMTCNEIHNCTRGIAMRSLGVDGVGPVGTIASPSDNSWYIAASANRAYCFDDGITSTDGASLNTDWVFRTSPSEFDIPGGLTTIAGLSTDFNPTVTSGLGTPCYSPYKISADSDSLIINELQNKYTDVAVKVEVGTVIEPNDYFKMICFWNDIIENLEIIDLLSGEFEGLYNFIATSNIPTFSNLSDSISARNFIYADEINASVIPVNDIEYYWKYTNEVYLHNLNDEGKFILTEELESELELTAGLPGGVYGQGVYNARGMLDTILDVFEDNEEDLGRHSLIAKFNIFPNPATLEFYLTFTNIELQSFDISVLNSFGKEMIYKRNMLASEAIDISKLSPGIYLVHLFQNNVTFSVEKLIIL